MKDSVRLSSVYEKITKFSLATLAKVKWSVGQWQSALGELIN